MSLKKTWTCDRCKVQTHSWDSGPTEWLKLGPDLHLCQDCRKALVQWVHEGTKGRNTSPVDIFPSVVSPSPVAPVKQTFSNVR